MSMTMLKARQILQEARSDALVRKEKYQNVEGVEGLVEKLQDQADAFQFAIEVFDRLGSVEEVRPSLYDSLT